MGILKKLTDEYFDKGVRAEDGHIINVCGIDLIVPNTIKDEDEFINSITRGFDCIKFRVFPGGESILDKEVVIREYHCDVPAFGGDYRFSILLSEPSEYDLDEGYSDMWKKAVIKLLKHVMEGVDVFTSSNYNISAYGLIGTKTFVRGELEKIFTNKRTIKMHIESLIKDMKVYVDKNFPLAVIGTVDLDWGGLAKDLITSEIISPYGTFSVNGVIGYVEMKKWWDKEMEKIKTEGAEKYFKKK